MFMTWSIAEAWDWLVHLPVLGFLTLLLLAFFLLVGGLALRQAARS